MGDMKRDEFDQIVSTFCLHNSDHIAAVKVYDNVEVTGNAYPGCRLTFANPNLAQAFSDPDVVLTASLCWLGYLSGFPGSSGIFSMFTRDNPSESLIRDHLEKFQQRVLNDLQRAGTAPTLQAQQDLSALYLLRVLYGYTRQVPYPNVDDFFTRELAAWLQAKVPTALLLHKFVAFDQTRTLTLEEALEWQQSPQALLPELFPFG